MTVESDILDALLSRVEDLPYSPPIPVAWPNFKFDPEIGSKYIDVRHLPNDTDRIMIRGETDRLHGILLLTINYPLNQGIELPINDAAIICDHFATDTVMESGDTRVRVTRRPIQREGLNVDGWWKVPIQVHYEAFA